MDIIGSLPVEIAERIFWYLQPEDLARCSGVCKEWHYLANSDRCWRQICKDLSVDCSYVTIQKSLHYENDLSCSAWKKCFIRHARIVKNWERNTCKSFDLEIESETVYSTSHNSTLFIGCANNLISVYSVTKSEVKLTQDLREMVDHEDAQILELVSDGKTLVAVFWPVILVYTRINHRYRFSHFLYIENGQINWSEDKRDITRALDFSPSSVDRTIGVAGDLIFLYNKYGKVLMWDYTKRVVRAEFDCNSSTLLLFEGDLYLANLNRLCVYNQNCHLKLSIMTGGNIDNIYCNNRIILVRMVGSKMSAWDRKSGKYLFTRAMSVPKTGVLHPTRNVIVYLLYSRQPPNDDKRDIKAYDLDSQTTLWKTTVQKSHFNVIGHNLFIVAGRYIVFYVPSFGREVESCAVYDSVDGKYLYTIEEDSYILTCTDQLMMLGDYSNNVKIQFYA